MLMIRLQRHGKKHQPCPKTTNCESCHGAGSKFVPLMARRAPKSALVEAGLRRPSKKMCEQCHATRGVTVTVPTGPSAVGAEQCLMCHDPKPHAPCPQISDCESCHGLGSMFVEVMSRGGTREERLAAGLKMPSKAETCNKCHATRNQPAGDQTSKPDVTPASPATETATPPEPATAEPSPKP